MASGPLDAYVVLAELRSAGVVLIQMFGVPWNGLGVRMRRRNERERYHKGNVDRSMVSFLRFGQTQQACPLRPP